MLELYPLKFNPLFFEKIWGGENIKKLAGLSDAKGRNIGEAWLLSGVEGQESIVTNGHWEGNTINEMLEVFMDDLAGQENYSKFGNEFPLLIKILDTTDWLSVQVHPDDEQAQNKHQLAFGKTEMWYILQAETNARLISGWTKKVNKQEISDRISDGTLEQILQYHPVKKDDFLFTPAGTVHAIGPNLTLAEIQQTSDITYRLYDWNRKQDPKNPRLLHIEDSLEVLNFDQHDEPVNSLTKHHNSTLNIVDSEFFKVNHLVLDKGKSIEKDLTRIDSFVVYLCLNGNADVVSNQHVEYLKPGEVILIPASFDGVEILASTNLEMLEIYTI